MNFRCRLVMRISRSALPFANVAVLRSGRISHTFLSDLMDVDVHLVWKSKKPIATTGANLSILPSSTVSECPRDLDLLFVLGGVDGTIAIMQDDEILSFLADRGKRARYVTSVCTGSLILGSAGLLKGYRATSKWALKDMLPLLGAIPAEGRVVTDRNRITGGRHGRNRFRVNGRGIDARSRVRGTAATP